MNAPTSVSSDNRRFLAAKFFDYASALAGTVFASDLSL